MRPPRCFCKLYPSWKFCAGWLSCPLIPGLMVVLGCSICPPRLRCHCTANMVQKCHIDPARIQPRVTVSILHERWPGPAPSDTGVRAHSSASKNVMRMPTRSTAACALAGNGAAVVLAGILWFCIYKPRRSMSHTCRVHPVKKEMPMPQH